MCTIKQKRRATTSMASLFPLTPYTVLRSLLSVALSSVTAKSIIMIPYILHFVNVQLHRRGCTVSADGTVQPTATRVFNFKRPGCSTGALYSSLQKNLMSEEKAPLLQPYRHTDPDPVPEPHKKAYAKESRTSHSGCRI